MTYEEACDLVGHAALPLLDRESRERLIDTVIPLSKNGTKSISPFLAKLCRDQFDLGSMTYEEACGLLGFGEPPELGPESRRRLIRTTGEITDNGQKPIDPKLANLYRNQIEEFY